MYDPISPNVNFVEQEKKIEKFWRDEKIFEKFYQEDSSHNSEGNGLGLAIVKKIVDLHKASIEVKSKLGEGSSFIVTIPKE